MTIYQVLCLIGVPTLILVVFKYLWSQIKHNTEDSKALKAGIQALLRAQMISDFNKYSEKGYAPIYARDNFENCWKQYHSLGVNGVMDDLHRKFLELPTDPRKNEQTNQKAKAGVFQTDLVCGRGRDRWGYGLHPYYDLAHGKP